MTTRAGLVGLGTGGLLLAVLFYPLYWTLPGLYVRDWPTGSPLASAVAVALALTLIVLAGRLAAQGGRAMRRGQCIGLGALAGGLAALLVFCGLGAAAAGTLGSSAVLQSEPALPGATQQSVWTDAVRQTVRWTQWTFWGMLLIGLFLGAAGGWSYTPRPISDQPLYDKRDPQMALNVSITAVPAAMLAVLVSAALFLRMSEVMPNLAMPIGVVDGPVTTALLLYLAAHAALTLVTPHEARQADHQCGLDEVKMAAYVGIAAPPVLGVGLVLISPQLALQPVVIGSGLLSMAMGARLAWVLRALVLPRRAELPPPPNARQAALFGSIAKSNRGNLVLLCIGCGVALVFPVYVAPVAAVINLWLIPLQRMSQGSLEPSASLVRHLYQAQAMVSLGNMACAGAVLTGLYLFYAALGRGFQRLNRS